MNTTRVIRLMLPEERRGFSTCCAAPPMYAVSITFEKRNQENEMEVRTYVRRLCPKHAARYASTFRLTLPAESQA